MCLFRVLNSLESEFGGFHFLERLCVKATARGWWEGCVEA